MKKIWDGLVKSEFSFESLTWNKDEVKLWSEKALKSMFMVIRLTFDLKASDVTKGDKNTHRKPIFILF
jgi:hypothetical protein